MSLPSSSVLPLRRPCTVITPSGCLSGTSDAANDGAGGRSTLMGGSAATEGSGPMLAPEALDDWHPAAPRTAKTHSPTACFVIGVTRSTDKTQFPAIPA